MPNYDFFQNANAAARMLTYDLVHHILAGHQDESDKPIISLLLQHYYHFALMLNLSFLIH